MKVEIICVGTELLLGDILNTNAKFLSERMAELGFNLFSQSVVGDNPERLEKQLDLSLSRSDIVVLSGGLGPTNDDITKEITAKVLNLPLEMDNLSLRRIEEYFARTGRVMSENNKKQALTIKGATVLQNDHGTAPGYFIKSVKGTVVLLPGPPKELVPMFNEKVVPLLSAYSDSTLVSHNVRIFGVGESTVAECCGDMLEMKNPTVATYAQTGEVDIRITASAPDHKKADDLCRPVIDDIKKIFDSHVYGVDVDDLQHRVVNLLREKNMKLATAESCTAGMLSGKITEVPGSSEVFEMGVTAYANYIKIQALGVDEATIASKGAVCDEVAAQMAVGIRTMCNAHIGVGITGVAGPGQSEGKPAGLVYIAIADENKVYVRKIMGRGDDRETTRILATSTALDMVRRYIEGREDILSHGTIIGEPIDLMTGYDLPKKKVEPALPLKETVASNPISKSGDATAIYSGELLDFMSTVDDENDDEIPEKLEVEDNSMEFIFDDDYTIDSISAMSEKSKEIEPDAVVDDSEDKAIKPKKKGFFKSLFPVKGDPVSEKVRKSIFLVAFCVLLGTMGYLVNYFVESLIQQYQISNAAKVWDDDNSMDKNANGIFIGFESLLEKNKDVKAWMKINGTNINNPVYQTNNNDYYIDHDMNKSPSRYGALFIDKSSRIGKQGNTQNVIIYGHHMRDGTMFGPLKKYRNLDFYKEHPVIDFTTLYHDGDYKVFAVFITNTMAKHDKGNVFETYRQSTFAGEEDFLQMIDDVKKRSIIDTGVDVRGDDEIITLSTCTYEFEEARLIVMARRVRDDETDEQAFDTSAAKLAKNPLYPAVWYEKKGGKQPTYSSAPSNTTPGDGGNIFDDIVSGFDGGNVSDPTVSGVPGVSSTVSGTNSTPVTPPNTSGTSSTASTPAGGTVTSVPTAPDTVTSTPTAPDTTTSAPAPTVSETPSTEPVQSEVNDTSAQ